MTHPNAHLFAELAERAKTDPEVMQKIQFQVGRGVWPFWEPGLGIQLFDPDRQWRFKPEPVTVEAWAILSKRTGETVDLYVNKEVAEMHCPDSCIVWALRGNSYTPEDQQ